MGTSSMLFSPTSDWAPGPTDGTSRRLRARSGPIFGSCTRRAISWRRGARFRAVCSSGSLTMPVTWRRPAEEPAESDMAFLALDPARAPPPIVERAYQLADSGLYSRIEDVCSHLIGEGYDNVLLHFEARAAIRADLLKRCRGAGTAGIPAS